MKNTTCKNCGGDEAIHHYETRRCPAGGYEAPVGCRQKWDSTTFESEYDEVAELRDTVNQLLARIEALETQIENLQSGSELQESVRIWDIDQFRDIDQ